MEDKKDISIVIPFHNEEESLKKLIPSLIETTHSLDKSFEIIFINDVSSDNSLEVVRQFKEKFDEIKILQLKKRGGQTGCYKKAFAEAKGDYIIRMDSDLQDDPRDLPKFIKRIEEGSELVMGLREARKHKKTLRFASLVYDMIILLLFNSPLHSNSGSYIAFKADLVKNIPWHKNDHRYIPLIAMRRGAKNIREVFVRHGERKWGESKYKPVKKLIFGIPEVFLFLFRYLTGVYDNKK